MKKYYFLIAGLCVLLALLIGTSIAVDKKIKNNSSGNTITTSGKNYSNEAPGMDLEITEKEAKVQNASKIREDYEVIQSDIGELVIDAGLTEEEWQKRLDQGFNSEMINGANKECVGLFYYDNIDPSLRQLYLEIYLALCNYLDSFYICSTSPEDIDYAFNCVMGDHPEFFYSNGYLFTKYMLQDEIIKIDFTPGYTMDLSEAEDCMEYVVRYRNEFLKGIDINADDYTKIKYTYEFVILNTEYDINSAENQNILSVFMNGKSVCQGYAKAFQYLSKSLGIQSGLVVGYVGNDEGHAWNIVRCNNSYYYIDCTWGDTSYLENTFSLKDEGINYDYLNITTDELEITHYIDNFALLPPCNSKIDNYYVKEGLYFSGVDENMLAAAFANAKFQNKSSVELKCSDSLAYEELGKYLLDENHIFDYMDSKKDSVKYMQNKDLLIYSFPLN